MKLYLVLCKMNARLTNYIQQFHDKTANHGEVYVSKELC